MCNVGVVHQGQRLTLVIKAGHHLPGIHSQLNNLQRHFAPEGLGLLGSEHLPETPFAQPGQDTVVPDLFADQVGLVNQRLSRHIAGKKVAGALIGLEEVLNLIAQGGIIPARLTQKLVALFTGLDMLCPVKDLPYSLD
jgi:hypothetical protein